MLYTVSCLEANCHGSLHGGHCDSHHLCLLDEKRQWQRGTRHTGYIGHYIARVSVQTDSPLFKNSFGPNWHSWVFMCCLRALVFIRLFIELDSAIISWICLCTCSIFFTVESPILHCIFPHVFDLFGLSQISLDSGHWGCRDMNGAIVLNTQQPLYFDDYPGIKRVGFM